MTILIIHSQPAQAALLCQKLAQAGKGRWQVVQTDGLSALAESDAVVLDITAAPATQVRAFVQLEARRRALILLADDAQDPILWDALGMGAEDYVLQSESVPRILVHRLRQALDRRYMEQTFAVVIRQLEACEAGFRNIISKNVDGILVIHTDGTIRFANPAAEALFRRPGVALVGALFGFPIVEGETAELDVLLSSGESRVVEMRVTEIEWENEAAFLASLRDITERKQIETALQISEANYRRIVDTAQEGIWVLDTEARTSYVNAHMAAMLGYTPEEMMGLSMYDFVFPEDQQVARNNFVDRERGIAAQHDFCFRRKDGSALWTIVSASPLLDADGQFLGVLGMITDVTERVQAERALRQSEQLYRTLARGLPKTAVLLFDRDLCFLVAEGQALTEQGFLERDLEGKTLWEALPPERAQALAVHYRAALAGADTTFETRYGDRVYFVHILPIRDERGEISHGLVIAQDVTEHKQAAQLEARAEAEAVRSAQRQREIHSWEQLSHLAATSGGVIPAASNVLDSETFEQLSRDYGAIMELALEQRAYKVKQNTSAPLRLIAETLGRAQAGPRDVVELHLTALKQKRDSNPLRFQAYVEEARLLVLELMGYLVSFYRNQSKDCP